MSSTSLDSHNLPLIIAGMPGQENATGIAGAAVVHANHIQYAIAASGGELIVLTNDLSQYQSTGNFSQLKNWKQTIVANHFPASESAAFKVVGGASMVHLGDHNYVFWRDYDGQLRVLRCRPDMSGKLEIATLDVSAIAAGTFCGNPAAFPLPGQLPSLAGKLGVVVVVSETSTYLYPLTYDPVDFVPYKPWPLRYTAGGYPVVLSTDATLGQSTRQVSAAWIDQGTIRSSGTAAPQPHVSLVVTCADVGSKACQSFAVPLLEAFDRLYKIEKSGPSGNLAAIPVAALPAMSDELGVTLTRAPDGTAIAAFADAKGCLRTAAFVPNGTDAEDPNHGKPGLYSPTWATNDSDPDGSGPRISTGVTPALAFIPLPISSGQSPGITLPGNATKKVYDCQSQKHVWCMFGSASAMGGSPSPTLSTFYWGEILRVPNYLTWSSIDSYKHTLILNLVADTFPYPVPDTSIWGPDSPSGMINWLLCTYEYLVSKDKDTTVQITSSIASQWVFSESSVLGLLGAEADYSGDDGTSDILTRATSVHSASGCSVTTKAVPADLATGGSSSDPTQLTIGQEGALFGTTPMSELGLDVCAVLLRGASDITGAIGYSLHPIKSSPPAAIAAEYQTYCYTPGNPRTYAEQVINARMAALFATLSPDEKADFVIDGKDYGALYSGNYVQNVVAEFGVPCLGPDGSAPYLEFAFSESSTMRGEYQSTASFTDASRTFLDQSFYAGFISHEDLSVEVGFFGLIDASASAWSEDIVILGGVNWSHSTETTGGESNTTGVSLGEYLNPLAPGEAYTARMYLLRSSPLWALELRYFGFPAAQYPSPPNVDFDNSAPIRILFTVPYLSETLANRLPDPPPLPPPWTAATTTAS